MELSTCRGYTNGCPLSIPWNIMLQMVSYHDLDHDDAVSFIAIIRLIDNWFIGRKEKQDGSEQTE